MRRTARLFVLLGLLSACGADHEIARAIRVDSTATVLPLDPPIRALAGPRAVCLEFDPPGGSRRVAELELVLTGSDGARDTLRGALDRTGEAVVCVRDNLAVARTYVTLSARAARPLIIHRIAWSSPRDSVNADVR